MSCPIANVSPAARAVHTFAAIVSASRFGLERMALGPQSEAGRAQWRVVFTSNAVSVWAHGITDGTLAVSLFVSDAERTAAMLRDMSWMAVASTASRGEVRLSGLSPIGAAAVVERTLRAHAATSSVA